jgi:hypothetical protein
VLPDPSDFYVDPSAPQVAHGFAALYHRCGVSKCNVLPAEEVRLRVAIFASLAARELLGWPVTANIDLADETWQLGTEAMREIQRLPMYGQTSVAASESTDAETILEFHRQIEKDAMPLDLAAFNRYHHGGKVNGQDHQLLREALALEEAQGADMPALGALVARLPN